MFSQTKVSEVHWFTIIMCIPKNVHFPKSGRVNSRQAVKSSKSEWASLKWLLLFMLSHISFHCRAGGGLNKPVNLSLLMTEEAAWFQSSVQTQMNTQTCAWQSGALVGGRIPFESWRVEKLVCEQECMRDVLHGATPQLLKHELCPFSTRSRSLTQTKTRLGLLIPYDVLTAFQVGAYTGRGWFWSEVLVN